MMKLGVIGGSGLYSLEGLKNCKEVKMTTAFGDPSDVFFCGTLNGCDMVFLPRHARGHRILPSEINHRANIMAFKMMGVSRILSISAVGSLRQHLRPRDIVLPDQYYDRTKSSKSHTFFGGGMVAHAAFGDPTCPDLGKRAYAAARKVIKNGKLKVKAYSGGTYVNMEGPAFSTRAESNAYRKLGFDVIGMTSLLEAKLCREAEICYQPMAMVTDYDCWHQTVEDVTVEMVMANLSANTKLAQAVLVELVAGLPEKPECSCMDSLATSLITARALVPKATRQNLEPIIGRYFK
jgi:5'-methylthioadenosine phosphorylase